MKNKLIETDGVSLFSESFGDPNHPAIILVMGAMSSGIWWPDDFCIQLASRNRYIIRYDHRDTGRSTSYNPGENSYSLTDLADDAIKVLQGYALCQAHFVGMSLGGFLSQILALKYPKRILSLTLIASECLAETDPQMPTMDPAILQYHAGAEKVCWSDRAAVVDYLVGAWRILSGSAHPFDDAAIRLIASADFDRTPNILTTFNHATLGMDNLQGWLGRLQEIRSPTLVIHGTEDPVLPYAHGLALKTAISGAELLTLQGTGHELHRADWPVILNAIERHTAQ